MIEMIVRYEWKYKVQLKGNYKLKPDLWKFLKWLKNKRTIFIEHEIFINRDQSYLIKQFNK